MTASPAIPPETGAPPRAGPARRLADRLAPRIAPRIALTALLALAAGAAPLAAEDILFRCFFDGVCDPDRMKCEAADLDVRFRIDPEAGTVAALTGQGSGAPGSTYSLILGDRALTILEVPFSGGTTTTTIPTGGGWSVHSDNGFEGATLAPRQYLGECTAL